MPESLIEALNREIIRVYSDVIPITPKKRRRRLYDLIHNANYSILHGTASEMAKIYKDLIKCESLKGN